MTLKPENFLPPTEDEILEALTADERTALEEADREDAAALETDAAGDDPVPEAIAPAAAEPEDKPEPEQPAAQVSGEEKPAPAVAAAASPEDAAGPEPDEPRGARQVVPDWKAPENSAAKLAEIAAARDALADRFDNAEIGAKELLAEQAKLNAQERDIERAQDRAQMASEMTTAVWTKSTVPTFLEQHPHYRDNDTLLGLLDAEVRRQQVAAEKGGKDPLDPSILVAADKAIKASLASLGVAPAKDPAPKPAATAKTASAKPGIPPTLANVPAATISGTDSKHAALDRLADTDPIKYEEMLGRMPEAEQDAYLARS